MQIPVDKWYPAVFKRCSRRQFNARNLPESILSHLLSFTQNLNRHIQGARAVVVTDEPEEIFKGAIGSYGKIKGAPAYVAFLGNMKDPNVQEKVGILGEFFILEATSIGLATCWVGGFFKPDVAQAHINFDSDEQVIAISPLGFVEDKFTLEEKLMSSLVTSRKRKNLETLLVGSSEVPLSNWVSTALEAARLAPSAVNRQPWRFTLENEVLRVSVDNGRDSSHVSKRLDCGIAMAHIEVGAKYMGVTGEWKFLEGLDVAQFKPLLKC
jgi:hypothetical protein